MKKVLSTLLIIICISFLQNSNAQNVAINNDGSVANPSAILDAKSTTKGLLIPRMSKAEKNAIVTPATGLLIFQNTPDSIGFYYYSGSSWTWLSNANPSTAWFTTGNLGTDTAVNFIGTRTIMPLRFKQNNGWVGQFDTNTENIYLGGAAGERNRRGLRNTIVGDSALAIQSFNPGFNYSSNNTAFGTKALYANQPTASNNGINNVAVGSFASKENITGANNTTIGTLASFENDTAKNVTAIGYRTLYQNNRSNTTAVGAHAGYWNGFTSADPTRGIENTMLGYGAMYGVPWGSKNVAIGNLAMANVDVNVNGYATIAPFRNVAIGDSALYDNSGNDNVAIGFKAAVSQNNPSASQNVAIGSRALHSNISGGGKTAIGYEALYSDTLSDSYSGLNTAVGYQAARNSRFSEYNTAIGGYALLNAGSTGTPTTPVFNGGYNTAVGHSALIFTTTGFGNTAIGVSAGSNITTGIGNVAIGHLANNNGSPSNSVAVGQWAGFTNNATNNTFVGSFAGTGNNAGFNNTFLGAAADNNNINGDNITAVGAFALNANTTSNNTAIGFSAARSSITAFNILAVGDSALYSNTANTNLSIGSRSMRNNTTGAQNTVIGHNAMYNNTTLGRNIAIGESALEGMNFGTNFNSHNIAIGFFALDDLNPTATATSGNQNVAVGSFTGSAMSTGYYNTLMGYNTGAAISTGFGNTFIGHSGGGATTGDQNTTLGYSASVSTAISNASAIGYNAAVTQSNSIVLGDGNVTKWGFGTNVAAANILEFGNTTARLTTGGVWTNASDINLKTNITTLNSKDVLNKIMQLPITRWNYKIENKTNTHIGPMAQDFYKLFNVGNDNKTISSIDPSGVALIGIQQLKKEIEELKEIVLKQQNIINKLQKQ